MGQMATGLAHDFNNLLTLIFSHLELLMERQVDVPTLQGLGEIKKFTERAATLTRQLLAFGRGQLPQRRPVDINAIVVGIHQMLSRLLGEKVELLQVLESNLPPALADP